MQPGGLSCFCNTARNQAAFITELMSNNMITELDKL
jgi:hypothetical protein